MKRPRADHYSGGHRAWRGWRPAGRVLAALGLACLVGGMLFFGAIMAPLVFTALPPDAAGQFIRAAFPRYYGFILGSAAVAALGSFLALRPLSGAVLLAIMALTLWLLFGLMPELDLLRTAGDTAGFARGHRLSVLLNGAQLLAAAAVMIRLALV